MSVMCHQSNIKQTNSVTYDRNQATKQFGSSKAIHADGCHTACEPQYMVYCHIVQATP